MYYNDPYANGNYGNGTYPSYPQGPYSNNGYTSYPNGHKPTNSLAIAAFILSMMQFFTVITVIPAIICGHIALRQIKQDGSEGRGLAIAALIISYIFLALIVIGTILFFVLGGIALTVGSNDGSYAMALASFAPLIQF